MLFTFAQFWYILKAEDFLRKEKNLLHGNFFCAYPITPYGSAEADRIQTGPTPLCRNGGTKLRGILMKISELIAASGNEGKIREIQKIFKGARIIPMHEAGFNEEIEETGSSFRENALIKAKAVSRALGKPALADDSGLCVEALGGAPGVYSARFCGRHGDDAANNALLLEKMADVPDGRRAAYFASCVALCTADGRELTADGRTYGRILRAPEGEGGFGYDPLFYSDELGKSFGAATAEEKNAVSHRGKALAALAEKLAGVRL